MLAGPSRSETTTKVPERAPRHADADLQWLIAWGGRLGGPEPQKDISADEPLAPTAVVEVALGSELRKRVTLRFDGSLRPCRTRGQNPAHPYRRSDTPNLLAPGSPPFLANLSGHSTRSSPDRSSALVWRTWARPTR